MSQASPPWVHQLGSFGVFQGFPLYWEGKPLTRRGNPWNTPNEPSWCTQGGLAWDIQKEPNQCICSAPGLGHSKRTEPVYLQCTRPGKLEMDPGEKPTWRIRLENYECIKGI